MRSSWKNIVKQRKVAKIYHKYQCISEKNAAIPRRYNRPHHDEAEAVFVEGQDSGP